MLTRTCLNIKGLWLPKPCPSPNESLFTLHLQIDGAPSRSIERHFYYMTKASLLSAFPILIPNIVILVSSRAINSSYLVTATLPGDTNQTCSSQGDGDDDDNVVARVAQLVGLPPNLI